MFAIRPQATKSRSAARSPVGAAAHEAGQHSAIEGITGELGPIDPAVFGIDPSDFATHAGSGTGSGSRGAPNFDTSRAFTGEKADDLLATATFRDAIRDQVMAGKTGAKHVHLYEDFEEFVNAYYRHSLEVQVHALELIGIARELSRKEYARHLANESPGFTNPSTRMTYIYSKAAPGFVTIHEMIHVYTHAIVYSFPVMLEGLADYFTSNVCEQWGIPFEASYSHEYTAMKLLADTVGDTALAFFTFHGTEDGIRTIVDSKGNGTWKRYKHAVEMRRYEEASALLLGAKGIHDGVTKGNEDIERMNDEKVEHAKKTDAERERAMWPEEATTSFSRRPMKSQMVNGTPAVGIPLGGNSGVRETWRAIIKMEDGSSMTTIIVALESDMTWVQLSSDIESRSIHEIELSPRK